MQAKNDAQSALVGLANQLQGTTARITSTIDSLHQKSAFEHAKADAELAQARQLEVAATLRQSAAAIAEQDAQVSTASPYVSHDPSLTTVLPPVLQARVESAQTVTTSAQMGAEVALRMSEAVRQSANAEREATVAAALQELNETRAAVSASTSALRAQAAADVAATEATLSAHLAGVQTAVKEKQDALLSGLSLVRQAAVAEGNALFASAQSTRDSLMTSAAADRAKALDDALALRASLTASTEAEANASRTVLEQQRASIRSLIATELQTLSGIRLQAEQAAADANKVVKEASDHAAAEVDRIKASAASTIENAHKATAAELKTLQGSVADARAKAASSLTALSANQAAQVSRAIFARCFLYPHFPCLCRRRAFRSLR
jgi:hypothetical protein